MQGQEWVGHNLGLDEICEGNMGQAMKHFIIAANVWDGARLKEVREGFMGGYVSKDLFAKTIRAHKDSVDVMKSANRDKPVDFNWNYLNGESH